MSESRDTVKVRYETADDGTLIIDDADMPCLTFARHPVYGYGWTLWYLDAGSVEDYFIPGDLTDVDAAVASAQRWLALREATS
jgi:hypothetical protein